MARLILISFFIISTLAANSSNNISKAFAFAIFDENGQSENIQNISTTKYDYEGISYTKIVVFGKMLHNRKIVIAYEYTFKHYSVTSGLLQVKIDNKLYDSRVFVK